MQHAKRLMSILAAFLQYLTRDWIGDRPVFKLL